MALAPLIPIVGGVLAGAAKAAGMGALIAGGQVARGALVASGQVIGGVAQGLGRAAAGAMTGIGSAIAGIASGIGNALGNAIRGSTTPPDVVVNNVSIEGSNKKKKKDGGPTPAPNLPMKGKKPRVDSRKSNNEILGIAISYLSQIEDVMRERILFDAEVEKRRALEDRENKIEAVKKENLASKNQGELARKLKESAKKRGASLIKGLAVGAAVLTPFYLEGLDQSEIQSMADSIQSFLSSMSNIAGRFGNVIDLFTAPFDLLANLAMGGSPRQIADEILDERGITQENLSGITTPINPNPTRRNSGTSTVHDAQTPSSERIAAVVDAGAGWTTVRYADGRVERREGVRSERNNNPGNLEYGPFARSRGAVGSDGRFAVFPTREMGRAAKQQLIFGSSYINLSIENAMKKYAPPIENNTENYIQQIVASTGASRSTRIRDLSPEQRTALMQTIDRVEGGSGSGTYEATGLPSSPSEYQSGNMFSGLLQPLTADRVNELYGTIAGGFSSSLNAFDTTHRPFDTPERTAREIVNRALEQGSRDVDVMETTAGMVQTAIKTTNINSATSYEDTLRFVNGGTLDVLDPNYDTSGEKPATEYIRFFGLDK